jgi:ectoine hydroxylase-related dioxygenase (phytanoyl-CoA dioxygenase family)
MKLKSETLVGIEGTVLVWDSRLLHQSLPNRNKKMRMGLLWVVNSFHKPAVQRVENTGDTDDGGEG